MYQVQIPWNKVFKGLKYLLVLLILLGIGYVGYLTYYYATNSPYEVRVTNLTGSSATVSWYTNRPDGGVVYVKDKNSFTPVFPKFGSTVAYDDRDVAKAQEEWVNKQVSKATNDVDADYEISLDEKALNELPVKKKGKYYVHHVTINNLEEEKQYYFRVGNGVFMWNVNENNQKYSEYEAPTVKEFGFKTYKDPENINAPDSSYGRVVSAARNKDGFLVTNASTDAIVFLHAYTTSSNKVSNYLSSVTNPLGGWTIDKTSIRTESGEPDYSNYKQYESHLYVYAQLQNHNPNPVLDLVWGYNDAPVTDIIAGGEEAALFQGSFFDKLKYSFSRLDPLEKISVFQKSVSAGLLGTGLGGNSVPAPSNDKSANGVAVKTVIRDHLAIKATETNTGAIPEKAQNTLRESGKCGINEDYIDGKCVERPQVGAGVSNKDNNSLGAGLSFPNNKGLGGLGVSSPSSDALVGKSGKDGGCGTLTPVKLSDGTIICENAGYRNAIKMSEDAQCVGRVVRSCEVNDGCFCEWVGDASGAGYSRVAGESCTPAFCASYANGDYNDGVQRVKRDAQGNPILTQNGEEILCRQDTTSNGCKLDDNKYTRGGVICKTGFKAVGEGDSVSCVKDENYKPTGGKEAIDRTNPDIFSDGVASASMSAKTCTAPGTVLILGQCVYVGTAQESEADKVKKNCSYNEDISYNCGSNNGVSCSEFSVNGGCSTGESCVYTRVGQAGFCVEKSNTIGFQSAYGELGENVMETLVEDLKILDYSGNLETPFDCFLELNSKGDVVDKKIVEDVVNTPDSTTAGNIWVQARVSQCLEGVNVVDGPDSNIRENKGDKVFAAQNVDIKTVGSALIIFPESGTYDVKIGSEEFKNVYVNKDNKHFFYKEVNGKSGYQLPKDTKKPGKNDDVLLPASGAVVTLYEKAKNQSMKLSKGINIVSFNYLPSRVEGKNMNAKQLMRILNSSGTKVTRITTFEGGKWLGGLAYDANKGEIVGNDFLVLPGKGYLIVSNTDYTATVPGYGIKNSIPVALSDGWNLIGVNGYSKTYTAASMIKTVNEIEGLGANNVTWWPTSKGRYESFQKSEGTEYGFDFPLLKDVGYFVRINKFDREGAKSVIWNPGGDLHGENGSK